LDNQHESVGASVDVETEYEVQAKCDQQFEGCWIGEGKVDICGEWVLLSIESTL